MPSPAELDDDGDARGVAITDFDRDGRVDLAVINVDGPLKLFRNVTAPAPWHRGRPAPTGGAMLHRPSVRRRAGWLDSWCRLPAGAIDFHAQRGSSAIYRNRLP
jgi:hypothetical protein